AVTRVLLATAAVLCSAASSPTTANPPPAASPPPTASPSAPSASSSPLAKAGAAWARIDRGPLPAPEMLQDLGRDARACAEDARAAWVAVQPEASSIAARGPARLGTVTPALSQVLARADAAAALRGAGGARARLGAHPPRARAERGRQGAGARPRRGATAGGLVSTR